MKIILSNMARKEPPKPPQLTRLREGEQPDGIETPKPIQKGKLVWGNFLQGLKLLLK